jgi:HEAT repeat protein
LIGLIAQAPDYGDYAAFMDGKPMNLDERKPSTSEIPLPGPDVIYGYLPEVYVARDWALGMVDMVKGRHTLSFVCTGRDSRSAGYKFGINDIVLEKMPDLAEQQADDDATATPASASGPVYRGRPLADYMDGLKRASSSTARIPNLYAIGEFGPDGAAAVPALTGALSDADANLRSAAASALAKVGRGDPATAQALIRAFGDSEARVRICAALALRNIGPEAAAAVPLLTAALKDSELTVRLAAAQALGAIGTKAEPAVPALAAILADKNEGRLMFRTAMIALGQIGPAATAALPVLKEIAAKRPDSTAAETILLIEGKGGEARTYY